MQLTELTRPQSCVHVSSYTESGDIRLMHGGLWATQLAVNLEQAHAPAEFQHVEACLALLCPAVPGCARLCPAVPGCAPSAWLAGKQGC